MVPPIPPPQSQPRAQLPWSLVCICWLCILSCPVPATIIWTLNNRRLGIVPPLLTRLFIVASLAIYALVWVRFFFVDEESIQTYRLQLVSMIMMPVLSWQLYLSQRSAFALYFTAAGRTAALKLPIVLGLIWLFVVASLQLGVETAQTDRDYKEFARVTASMEESRAKRREAEAFFQKFKSKYPKEKDTYWNLAIIYVEEDRIGDAKKELQDLLELYPNNKEARDYLEGLE